MMPALDYPLWWESAVVLAVGTALIVIVAAAACRFAPTAVWRRTAWRVSTVGLLALAVIELTGLGGAAVQLCRARGKPCQGRFAKEAAIEGLTNEERGTSAWGYGTGHVGPRSAARPVADEWKKGADQSQDAEWIEAGVAAGKPSLGVRHRGAPGRVAGGAQEAATPRPSPFSGPIGAWSELNRPKRRGGEFFAESSRGSRGRPSDPAYSRAIHAESPLQAKPPLGLVQSGSAEAESQRKPASPAPHGPARAVDRTGLVLARLLGGLWGAGVAVLLLRLGWSQAALCLFRRRCRVVGDEDLRRRAARIARKLDMAGPVALLEAPGLEAPVAFGWFRPCVALPAGFGESLRPGQQEAVLAHELAHLAAGDPAWQIMSQLVCLVLWWQPLAWWSRGRLQAAAEAAADEASLVVPDGPNLLAESLVALGGRIARPGRLGWLSFGGGGFRSGLGRRVERLVSLSGRRRAPRHTGSPMIGAAAAVVLLCAAISCTAWARPQVSLTEGGTTMNVLKCSWRRSLAAVFLLALWAPGPVDGAADDQGDRDRPAAEREDRDEEEGERRDRPDAERREKADRPDRDRRERAEAEHGEREHAERDQPDRRHPEELERERERREELRRFREMAERRREEIRQANESRDMLLREQVELTDHLDQLIRRLRELGDEGGEEAEQIEREAREVRELLEGIGEKLADRDAQLRDMAEEEERGGERSELTMHRGELEARLRDLRHALEELGDQEDERARKIQDEIREVEEARHKVDERLAHLEKPHPGDRERAEAERHLAEWKRSYEEARRAGRHEEAEELKRRAEEFVHRFEARRKDRHPDRPHPELDHELERRMHHLRVAAENLHAAGLHDQAERVMQEAERIAGDVGLRERERPVPPERHDLPPGFGPFGPPRPEHPEGPPRGDLERSVDELRGQIGELHRQMDEIRRHLHELTERAGK